MGGVTAEPVVRAAGAVVVRRGEVLLVHRPKYDDWSFPKGKLDPGEHPAAAAVREVEEESGVRVRLGRPLSQQRYLVGNGVVSEKVVDYWVGFPGQGEDGDVRRFRPNSEVDRLGWFSPKKARKVLTYEHDRETLDEALADVAATVPFVVLRHGKALGRKEWGGDDAARPLAALGKEQAELLVPVLGAFGVRRVLTSSSTRCRDTVEPYAAATGLDLQLSETLTEEDSTPAPVGAAVGRLVASGAPAVLCTHRPVLPWVFEALGVQPAPRLEPGELLVAHLREGAVVAAETHLPGGGA